MNKRVIRLRTPQAGSTHRAKSATVSVALLPNHACKRTCQRLSSARIPAMQAADGIIHLVFATRCELPPVVQALIDHLARAFRHENLASCLFISGSIILMKLASSSFRHQKTYRPRKVATLYLTSIFHTFQQRVCQTT